MITAVVGDDHPVVREGVVRMLAASGEVEVLGECGDGGQLLELVRRLRPQVAVSDYRMPGLDGAAVAEAVRDEGLGTRVLVLSAYTEASIVFTALQRGAAGFLSKEAGRREVLQAIRDVAAGRDVVAPELAAALVGEIRLRSDTGRPRLSGREREVLTAIAAGKSAPQMSVEMHLALSTVKTHIQRLYERLGVADRGAAVAEAMRRGIIS
ncbi:response regulator [Microlunatus capsulatus]|uniref:Two-component system nitrate/nitrite response regulator NarL n=1 Tax=Microlunatus capsulatus TaxID=99117 RepID=A0ABS4ZCJ6_9ACTN|nr:response regulator transcription factor [Microlunatus capsulatus]MBP2418780.1 two-component system nitrate/nitrite response regulator NarL [Microlunatus capsulatus]